MSGAGGTVHRRHHLFRVLPAVLAAPMALVVAGSLVARAVEGVEGTASPIGAVALGLLLLAVPTLAIVGAVAAWRNRRRRLWGVTGGLLVLGMVPFGLGPQIVLVGVLVVLGAMNTTPSRRWYDVWFALALLVSMWGIGALLYASVPGHSAVMVAVGGAIVFGASVSVLAVATGTVPMRDAASGERTETRSGSGERTATRSSSRGRTTTGSGLGPTRWLLAGVARGPTWRPVWFAVVLLSVAVSLLHFGGLAFRLYTRYWWWDVLTHGASGFGVAAIAYLLRPAAFTTIRRLFVFLPAFVLVVGAGFELYEFVFTTFYYGWTPEHYLEDTTLDLAIDVGGAVVFALFPHSRSVARRDEDAGR